MYKKALIARGGWVGHEPNLLSARFGGILEKNGFKVDISENIEVFRDETELEKYALIVPCGVTGSLTDDLADTVCRVVGKGTGIAGCHSGMCDAFRESARWRFMVGGQWVCHPGGDGVEYTVNVNNSSSPIVADIEDFSVVSEQYYVHIDPAVEVLATTRFPTVPFYHISNKPVDVPVCWTKYWGNGRIFYLSLGHHDDVFDNFPSAQIIMERGLLWAAEGKAVAEEKGLTTHKFQSNRQMY